MSKRLRTCLALATGVATIGSILAPAAHAAAKKYVYVVTVEATGTGDDYEWDSPPPDPSTEVSGRLNTSWTSRYQVAFEKDDDAQTVAVSDLNEYTPNVEGTLSGSIKLDGDQDYHVDCTVTDVPVSGNSSVQAAWGSGSDHPSYAAGKIPLVWSSWARSPEQHDCTNSQTANPRTWQPTEGQIPGLTRALCPGAQVDVPIERLGEVRIELTSDQTVACAASYNGLKSGNETFGEAAFAAVGFHYTAQMHYKVTLTQGGVARIASATFPLKDRMEAAKKELQTKIDELLAKHKTLDEELKKADSELSYAITEHNRAVLRLQDTEQQVQDLRRAVEDGIQSEDKEAMQRLLELLDTRQKDVWHWRLIIGSKGSWEIPRRLARRDDVAKQLLELAESLVALDFELKGLLVRTDSKPVYAVDLTSPYTKLLELDKSIAEQREREQELKELKKSLLDAYRSAHQEASKQLLAIADLIWSNALKNAAIDAAAYALDVGIAFSKEGLAGAAAEAASKLFESWAKGNLDIYPIGDPNPGKEAVEKWFHRGVVDTVGVNARGIAIERGVKETVGKVAKDYLGDGLKWMWPELAPSETPVPGPQFDIRGVKKTKGMLAKIKKIKPDLKTETFRNGFKKWFQSGVGRKLVVDAVKAGLKHTLKDAEMAAWRDYMMLDTQAQAMLALWQSAYNAYWEATDVLHGLELEKNMLLKGFNPDTGQTIKLQEQFSLPANLKIVLNVPHSAKPFANVPIGVYVNGVEAKRTYPKAFELSTENLPTATDLTIEVR